MITKAETELTDGGKWTEGKFIDISHIRQFIMLYITLKIRFSHVSIYIICLLAAYS